MADDESNHKNAIFCTYGIERPWGEPCFAVCHVVWRAGTGYDFFLPAECLALSSLSKSKWNSAANIHDSCCSDSLKIFLLLVRFFVSLMWLTSFSMSSISEVLFPRSLFTCFAVRSKSPVRVIVPVAFFCQSVRLLQNSVSSFFVSHFCTGWLWLTVVWIFPQYSAPILQCSFKYSVIYSSSLCPTLSQCQYYWPHYQSPSDHAVKYISSRQLWTGWGSWNSGTRILTGKSTDWLYRAWLYTNILIRLCCQISGRTSQELFGIFLFKPPFRLHTVISVFPNWHTGEEATDSKV